MKMVVAYIDNDVFEAIRSKLLELGFQSLSAWRATGTLPEATITGQYRGVVVERHVREKTRFECVVGVDHVSTVTKTVLELGGPRTFVFVVPVEQAYPTDTIKADDATVR
jgi:nitrogen regulatory protein PII